MAPHSGMSRKTDIDWPTLEAHNFDPPINTKTYKGPPLYGDPHGMKEGKKMKDWQFWLMFVLGCTIAGELFSIIMWLSEICIKIDMQGL